MIDPNSIPPVLFHYTNSRGIIGIVQDKAIWATRVQYLNDGKELGFAFDLARELLNNYASRFPAHVAETQKYLSTTRHTAWIFVASFSENGDQLSQWRAYGKPGDSYSLGFKGSALQQIAIQNNWRLLPCVYDSNQQREIITYELDRFCKDFQDGKFPNSDGPKSTETFLRYCHSYLLNVVSFMKHPAFAEEREWRLISWPTSEIRIEFRTGEHSLIPYTSIGLPLVDQKLQIVRTIIGPGAERRDYAMDAVVCLYLSKEVADWNIGTSAIPYRMA